ncbi:MAG: prepilin-type N-terminal cleavage/methylation domain-containing protein, partial [Candidatus Omnitrophica bacterium]|nr:prepilin-type N-terminal cleavage/methylation domain-containing protein [Candidatus Omnitrophota bacterium]
MNNRKGFTLIELMLVVIIIGVLASLVVPRLVGRSEEA